MNMGMCFSSREENISGSGSWETDSEADDM